MTMASRPAPSISRIQASMLRLRSVEGLLIAADMLDRGAAAAGARDIHHLDAVAGQQPHRGLVDLRRQHLLAAARHQRHALAARPAAVKVCGRSTGKGPGSEQGSRRASPRTRRRKVAPPGSPLHAGSGAASGLASQPSSGAQRKGAGRGISQAEQPAQQPVGQRAPVVSSRCGAGHDRPGACSSRPTGRWSCRTGTRGSDRRGCTSSGGRRAPPSSMP